ncbi:MAG: hypothetical protein ACRD41_08715, partial [Candidatus Acidiferrales bacterium]
MVIFAARKILTGDRAKFCGMLIALCLVLFAGPALYGQSEMTATSQQIVSYGAAAIAAQSGSASAFQPQNPFWVGVPTGT